MLVTALDKSLVATEAPPETFTESGPVGGTVHPANKAPTTAVISKVDGARYELR